MNKEPLESIKEVEKDDYTMNESDLSPASNMKNADVEIKVVESGK